MVAAGAGGNEDVRARGEGGREGGRERKIGMRQFAHSTNIFLVTIFPPPPSLPSSPSPAHLLPSPDDLSSA